MLQFCDAGVTGYGPESGCGASNKILIKGGTVVNAYHQQIADVYVEDGLIVAVQPNIKVLLILVLSLLCLVLCALLIMFSLLPIPHF